MRGDPVVGVGLGDQEGFLARAPHPVGVLVDRPGPVAHPVRWRRTGVGERQRVLRLVVGVARGHVEPGGQFVVLDGRPPIVDARGDELSRAGVFAHDAGLPGDELRGQPRLEAPPCQRVLRMGVALRPPQVGPGRQPVRPEDQTPLPVQGLDAAVRAAQVVDESLEDAVVAEQPQAGLVVDLEPDDGRMVGVPGDDRAGHALGVEQEGGMGVVRLLPAAPPHPFTRAELPGDLGVPAGQPRGHRVRRGAEDHADPAFVGAVEDRLEPVEVELAVLRLPRRPDRLTDPDDGEAGRGHQVEVGLEPLVRLVLVVVGRTEQHTRWEVRHRRSPRSSPPTAVAPRTRDVLPPACSVTSVEISCACHPLGVRVGGSSAGQRSRRWPADEIAQR